MYRLKTLYLRQTPAVHTSSSCCIEMCSPTDCKEKSRFSTVSLHQYPNPCQQHLEFSRGLPSQFCPGPILLSLIVLIGNWCIQHGWDPRWQNSSGKLRNQTGLISGLKKLHSERTSRSENKSLFHNRCVQSLLLALVKESSLIIMVLNSIFSACIVQAVSSCPLFENTTSSTVGTSQIKF